MCLEAVFILFNASIPLIITLKTQQQEQERYLFRLSINSLLTSAIFLLLISIPHLVFHSHSLTHRLLPLTLPLLSFYSWVAMGLRVLWEGMGGGCV